MIEGVLLVSAVGLICRDFWSGRAEIEARRRADRDGDGFRACRACGLKPMIARQCCFATSILISPPIRCSLTAGTSKCRSAACSTSAPAKETINRRLFLRFVTDRGEKRAMQVIWSNRPKREGYKYIGSFPDFVPMPAMNASAIDSTRGSISPGSTPRYERLRRRRLCSATETTRTPPASAILPICGVSGAKARWPAERLNKATTRTLCR